LIFGLMACEPWNFAQAGQQAPRAVELAAPERALARFDSSLRTARNLAVRLDGQAARGEEDLSPGLAALASRLQEIAAADSEIQADFDQIGKRLKATGVPAEILKRHQDAVADYRANLSRFRGEVETSLRLHDEWKQARSKALGKDAHARYQALKGKLAEMSVHLRDKVKDPGHTALDPQRLPHRRADLPRREPRLKAADFAALASAVKRPKDKAAQAPVLGLGIKAALPGPDDLAESPEVKLTPEIRALATQLGNDPIRIYEYVRGQIDFVPTHGSIQGASMCLSTRRCNDLDTASLLIALLRAAGVPARYAVGTVELPIAKVQNWVGGFTDPAAALNFIYSSGTPATALTSGGSPVAGRLEHTWVEAFVDYVPSRGTVHGPGDSWVPLDPSFKQFSYQDGIDLAAATGGFDSGQFFQQLGNGATLSDPDGAVAGINIAVANQKLTDLQGQIAAFVKSRNASPKMEDVVGGKAILPQSSSVLPGSLPYRVLVRGAGFARAPDALRHGLDFEVTSAGGLTPDLRYTASLAELAGKRITLSYSPATSADEAALESFLPAGSNPSPESLPTTIPAYLVRVKPELRIEGTVVATGASSTLGASGQFSLIFNSPGAGPQRVDNVLTTGTYNAIVLNLGRIGDPAARQADVRARRDRLQAGDSSGLNKDDVLGEFLHGEGLLYWSELELFDRVAMGGRSIVTSRLPSEGIFTYDLKVTSLFGAPRTVSSGALITDVDRDVQAVFARNGNSQAAVDFLSVTGAFASGAESAIYDQVTNSQSTGKGITAVSYLAAAAQQGIPIFQVTRDNVAQVLPKLQVSAAVKTDVQNSVNSGKVVTIPQREFVKDGFTGIGYIVFDLETGSGGYLISGGLAGGGFQLPTLSPITTFLLGALLTLLGIFASPLAAIILAVLSFLLIAYDAVSGLLDFSRKNPDLSSDALEAIVALVGFIAVVSIGLAIAGLFASSILATVVYGMFFAFMSALILGILDFFTSVFRSETTLPLTGRMGRAHEQLALAPSARWMLRKLDVQVSWVGKV